MKQYLETAEASQVIQTLPTLTYPNVEANLREFPLIEPITNPVNGSQIPQAPPHKLVGEAVGYIGREPRRILDIGCASGATALYLASHGHIVTAMDCNPGIVDFARERARLFGIPNKNFIPKVADARDLTADDKYEGVFAMMILHFLEETEAKKATRVIQNATVRNGINVISAYTDDNPDEEKSHREMKYLFNAGELSRMYMDGWQRLRDVEGFSGKPLDRRPFLGEDKALIATVGEIIARKTLDFVNIEPTRTRTRMNANRQLETYEY